MNKKIKAVVFDMDGVLIDSEPLWRKAMITGFSQYGITVTEDDGRRLTGLRNDEVVGQLLKEHESHLSATDISATIINEVCRLIQNEGQPISGFTSLAKQLHEKKIPLAVATSSPMQVVNTVLDKLAIRNYFSAVVSAEKFPYGKPHPQVYIEACSALSQNPTECLAIEDSLNGALAAKSARMMVLVFPDHAAKNKKGFGIADFLIDAPEEAYNIIENLL